MTKQIEWDELDADLQQVGTILADGDASSVLESDLRRLLLQSIRDNFTSSQGPQGQAWPPRKPRPGDDGHPLLMDTGALLQAATGGGAGHVTRIQPRQLEAGVNLDTPEGGIPGARAHQHGYPPNNLPARPWLGMRDEHQVDGEEFIADHFEQLLEAR